MTKRIPVSLLLLLSLLLPLQGQQPKPTPPPMPPDDEQDVVRITTNLVQVDVAVSKDGKSVTDLTAEDFEVFQDGKLQTITNFSYISNVPANAPFNVTAKAETKDRTAPPVPPAVIRPQDARRTIAIVIDDLGMSFQSIDQARKQLRRFLDDLPPNDLVAILRTGGEIGTLQQFTNDRRLLESAISQLRWNHCSRTSISVFPAQGTIEGSHLCAYDNVKSTISALRIILRGMRDLPGRKSMILMSDSIPDETRATVFKSLVDTQSAGELGLPSSGGTESMSVGSGVSHRAELQRVGELAIRASVVIYGVDSRGLQYTGPTAADKLSVERQAGQLNGIMDTREMLIKSGREGSELLATQTGGFLLQNSNDFKFKQILEDQQGYYLIGFHPGGETFDRKFHQIKARVKRSGFTVRTREGFYGYTDEEARRPNPTPADRLNNALASPFGATEIPIRLTSFFVDDAAAGPLVRSLLYFRPGDLRFTDAPGGGHVASVDLKGFLFGDNGRVLSERSLTSTFRLPDAAYERARNQGLIGRFDIPTRETGAFQVRIAVREVSSSRIGAAGQVVEIPDLRNGRLALSGLVVRDGAQSAVGAWSESSGSASIDLSAGNPAWRQFRQGSTLALGYAVYNARLDSASRLPRLTASVRAFRDGREIFTGKPTSVAIKGQKDLKRITTTSAFRLGPEMLPGDYVVQIIVTDNSVSGAPRVATQWIDLEIVK